MMTPSRPYLIRALYEWLLDNNLTPYVMVDANFPDTVVPEQFIKDGKIILNIAPSAVAALALGNQVVEFKARFSGVAYHIVLPVMAIQAIYSSENGRGMVFNAEEGGDDDDGGGSDVQTSSATKSKSSHLRVVK